MTSKKSSQINTAIVTGIAAALPRAMNQLGGAFQTGKALYKGAQEVKKAFKNRSKNSRKQERKRDVAPIASGMFNSRISMQKAHFATLPPLQGMHGVRLHVSFMMPDITVRSTAGTPAHGPQNGFQNMYFTGNRNALAILLDPTLEGGQTALSIAALSISTICLPLMYYAPRLSSLIRNFERFRIKMFQLETTPAVGTSEPGNVGFAYSSDTWKCVEADADNTAKNSFNFIRNVDNFASTAAWAPRHTYTCFKETRATQVSDLLYTLNAVQNTDNSYTAGDSRPRQTSQGVVMCAVDRTPGATEVILRHCTAHMTIDLYEMSLAEPVSGLRGISLRGEALQMTRQLVTDESKEVEEKERHSLRRASTDSYDQVPLFEKQETRVLRSPPASSSRSDGPERLTVRSSTREQKS
jgi:hypothetical protein